VIALSINPSITIYTLIFFHICDTRNMSNSPLTNLLFIESVFILTLPLGAGVGPVISMISPPPQSQHAVLAVYPFFSQQSPRESHKPGFPEYQSHPSPDESFQFEISKHSVVTAIVCVKTDRRMITHALRWMLQYMGMNESILLRMLRLLDFYYYYVVL